MKSRLFSLLHQTRRTNFVAIGVTTGFLTTFLVSKNKQIVHAEQKYAENVGEFQKALPIFTMAEVSKHSTKETGIWMTFKGGVYDLTSFVENHPGGKQILRSAGKCLDGCWKTFTIHKNHHVFDVLEEYRIGNLSQEEQENNEKSANNVENLFEYDPERVNAKENFFIRAERPFNAETKPSILVSSFLTPVDKFYVRNHMHVPVVNINDYKLELKNGSKTFSLSFDELTDKFPSYKVTSVIQCAGNRRFAMNDEENGAVQGTPWHVGAIGNAKWTGIRLRDVLQFYGLDQPGKHVQFIGLDCDSAQRCYGASIPVENALNDDVLLAYEMNDETLTRDHGYPLRVVIPGTIGARSVKWLNRIIVSDQESDSHWQQADYKILPASIKQPQQTDYDRISPIQQFNVQSAICLPSSNQDGNHVKILSIKPSDEEIKQKHLVVKGYAISGAGRPIHNVQVSIDNGKTWFSTKLNGIDQETNRAWAWVLWSSEIPLDKLPKEPFTIVCRATDSHINTQPDTSQTIWNVRGLMNNACHRVNVQLDKDFLEKLSK